MSNSNDAVFNALRVRSLVNATLTGDLARSTAVHLVKTGTIKLSIVHDPAAFEQLKDELREMQVLAKVKAASIERAIEDLMILAFSSEFHTMVRTHVSKATREVDASGGDKASLSQHDQAVDQFRLKTFKRLYHENRDVPEGAPWAIPMEIMDDLREIDLFLYDRKTASGEFSERLEKADWVTIDYFEDSQGRRRNARLIPTARFQQVYNSISAGEVPPFEEWDEVIKRAAKEARAPKPPKDSGTGGSSGGAVSLPAAPWDIVKSIIAAFVWLSALMAPVAAQASDFWDSAIDVENVLHWTFTENVTQEASLFHAAPNDIGIVGLQPQFEAAPIQVSDGRDTLRYFGETVPKAMDGNFATIDLASAVASGISLYGNQGLTMTNMQMPTVDASDVYSVRHSPTDASYAAGHVGGYYGTGFAGTFKTY